MNLEKIRNKYKEILEEPQSEDSDAEWQMAYSRMNKKRKKRILTQSASHNISCKQQNSSNILKTKQKLAQCIADLAKKNEEIAKLKEQSVRSQEKQKSLERKITDLKQQNQALQGDLLKQKVQNNCLLKEKEGLNRSVQSQQIDKDLMQHQIEFYQEQINAFKRKIKDKEKCYEGLSIHMKESDKYKTENFRLKEDVLRLKYMLSEFQHSKLIINSVEKKHYLGKISKEHDCWFSQDLILDTQAFLKKHKIGYGNKEYLASLVKFISKQQESVKKDVEKRTKRMCSSRIKEIKRKHNESFNLADFHEGTLKRSHLKSSMSKSRRIKTLNDSKRCTESFIYDKLQKSLMTHEINHNKDLCVEMLNSFRKGVEAMFQAKEVKKKKMMKLIEWVTEGILSIFPQNPSKNRQLTIQSDSIKILQ